MDESLQEANQLPALPQKSLLWLIIGCFFVVSVLVYGESLRNEFVRWDDGLLIYENPSIRTINAESLGWIFSHYDPELYIPLTFFTYQLDFLVGENHPMVYHAQNLLCHTANALLVTWLLFLLIRKRWIAIFGGALFLLHPLHTEAVVWASARKDVLSTFFFLVSLVSYLYYTSAAKRTHYYGSLIAFTLGLLSKVTVITLPAVLLFIDLYQGQLWKKEKLLEKIPYFILSGVFAFIALFGKTGVLSSSTLLEKVLMMPVSIMFYIEKLLVPLRLSVLYPFTDEVTFANSWILLTTILLIIIVTFGIFSLKRTKTFALGLGLFLITLLPSLPNFSKGDFFYFASDRYAYIPSIGILFLICAGLALIFEKLSERFQKAAISLCILVLLVFAVLSHTQGGVWKNSETLFENAVNLYPNAAIAYNNLGNYYTEKVSVPGNNEKVIVNYEKALELMRQYSKTTGPVKAGESKILSNLASSHRQRQRFDTARTLYREALDANLLNYQAWLGLGVLHAQQGEAALAEDHYRIALNIQPTFVSALINVGSLYSQQGRFDEAEEVLREAIENNPFYPQAHFNLGVVLRGQQRNREALEEYQKTIELAPSFLAARINAGILYVERKKLAEAEAEFKAVLEYDPQNQRALSALQQLKNMNK